MANQNLEKTGWTGFCPVWHPKPGNQTGNQYKRKKKKTNFLISNTSVDSSQATHFNLHSSLHAYTLSHAAQFLIGRSSSISHLSTLVFGCSSSSGARQWSCSTRELRRILFPIDKFLILWSFDFRSVFNYSFPFSLLCWLISLFFSLSSQQQQHELKTTVIFDG